MSWKIGGKFYRRTDFKMTLWYILTFLLSTLIICSFLYLRLKHQIIKEVDLFVLDETKELAAVLSRNPEEIGFLMRFEDDVMDRKYFPFFFQILDQNGKPLFILKRIFMVHPKHRDDKVFSEIIEASSDSYYGKGYQDITTRKPNIEKAKKLLGWIPKIGLEKSLKNTLYAFLEENEGLVGVNQ